MKYDYYKYQALGNDYIVIDPQQTDWQLTPANIRRLCDRHFGIGSDGILWGPFFDAAGHIHLRILNPDGSEAERSGNGIREFARYLFDAGYVRERAFSLETISGTVQVEYLDEAAHTICVDMGIVTFKSQAIPTTFAAAEALRQPLRVNGKLYEVSCAAVGNPHCVIPLERVSRELAEEIGPWVEKAVVFPHKINVQLLQVLDRQNIRIEIWERGAGYTLASGTSSCAAAAVACRLGLVDREIDVHMPGGIIHILIDSDWRLHMTGAVRAVGMGTLARDLRAEISSPVLAPDKDMAFR